MNYFFKLLSLKNFKDVFVCLQMRESLMKLQKGSGLRDYDSDSEERRKSLSLTNRVLAQPM